MDNRYFYHSFPRRKKNELESGLLILESIVENGLVLTPEVTEWTETYSNGQTSLPNKLYQKRVCFTELDVDELKNHSQTFGHFNLEFKIEALLKLGAIPVFYLPKKNGLASSLLFRLGEIQYALAKIESILKFVEQSDNKNQPFSMFINNGNPIPIEATLNGVETLFKGIFSGGQNPEQLTSSLRVLLGLFYPSERDSTLLSYYRQREWRILGNIAVSGNPVTVLPNENLRKVLLEIDSEFFGKEIEFPSGIYSRVDQCQCYKLIDGKHILNYVNRVLVPESVLGQTRKILSVLTNPPKVEKLPYNYQ